jgi:hypothetical protein
MSNHDFSKISIRQANGIGYNVDETCYPHFGYKGNRFNPERSIDVYTDFEWQCILALGKALNALNYLGDILNNQDMTTPDDVKMVQDVLSSIRSVLDDK